MKINFIGDIYLKNKAVIGDSLILNNIILNLEAPFSGRGEPAKNKINLSMDKDVFFKTFDKKNIIAVNLANNHIMDYGEEAFIETVEVLNRKSVKYFGAGTKKDNFHNPLIIEDTAIFGYTCRSVNGIYGNEKDSGSAPFELENVINEISGYKDKYKVILNLHWGRDYHSFPDPADVKKAHALINAGADMIIGHHPHITQSVEVYKGRYIFYSIGNSMFDDLSQESFYDGNKFNRFYTNKWKTRNKISICVEYDTEKYKTYFDYHVFRSRKLSTYKGFYRKIINKVMLNKPIFNIYRIYLKKKFNVEHFIENPRIPEIKKMLKFIGVRYDR